MEDKKVFMVIAAHPDDPEFGAGGTVAKWVGEGWQAIYVICTNGDKGTSDISMTSKKLAKIREQEQKNAGRVLGVNEIIFLGHPDGGLLDGPEFRGELVRLIRKYRPDIVITHDPNRKYMGHHDHRITGIVSMDAIFPYSRDHLFYPEHKTEGLTPHKVGKLYLMGPEEPNEFIDISETFMLKMKAISCHVSQVGDHTDDWELWLKRMRERAVAMGRARGMPLAESFHMMDIRR
jgi:LmbE family N-acetylglucosaminyl deacetylase